MLSVRFFYVILAAALVSVVGCGDKAKNAKCQPNAIHDCVCKDEHASLQTCNASGMWDACMCPENSTAGVTAGASGMGASGMGASGEGASGTGDDDGGGVGDTDSSVAMTDGGMTTDDAAVAKPAYSGPCTMMGDCKADETCDVATKVCVASCTMANGADCPAPPDGTATKACTIPLLAPKGTCSLTCGTGITCPTGMMCTVGLTSVCTWM